jgi:hypothetical protein
MPGTPLFIVIAGCGSEPTEFPPGLEPLTPNAAVFPEDESESADVVLGSEDAFDWANARGYVHAPLATVWLALKQPDTAVDRRAVDEWTVDYDVEPDYDVSYVVHTRVVDLVTIEYDLTWRQGAIDEEVVALRWQKTDGASIIDLLEGSIVLTAIDDEVTSVEIVEHLQTPGDESERLQTFFTDLWASVVAASHGESLPTYE